MSLFIFLILLSHVWTSASEKGSYGSQEQSRELETEIAKYLRLQDVVAEKRKKENETPKEGPASMMAMLMLEIVVRTGFERMKMILLLKHFKDFHLPKQKEKITQEIKASETAKQAATDEAHQKINSVASWVQHIGNSISK